MSGSGGHITFVSDGNLDPRGTLGGNADATDEVFLLSSPSTLTQVTASADLQSASPSVSQQGERMAFLTEVIPDLHRGLIRDADGGTTPLPSTGMPMQATTIDDAGTHVLFRSIADFESGTFPAGDLFLATCTAP